MHARKSPTRSPHGAAHVHAGTNGRSVVKRPRIRNRITNSCHSTVPFVRRGGLSLFELARRRNLQNWAKVQQVSLCVIAILDALFIADTTRRRVILRTKSANAGRRASRMHSGETYLSRTAKRDRRRCIALPLLPRRSPVARYSPRDKITRSIRGVEGGRKERGTLGGTRRSRVVKCEQSGKRL